MKLLILLAFVGIAFARSTRNEAEEFFFKDLYNSVKEKFQNFDWKTDRWSSIGKDIEGYGKELVEEQKNIALDLYEEIREQLKDRADQILAESKEQVASLKNTLLTNGADFMDQFQTVTKEAMDKIVAPLDFEQHLVSAKDVSGSLVERLTARMDSLKGLLTGGFDTYYARMLEALSESVDDVMIMVDSKQMTLEAAVEEAIDGVVSTAVNGAEEFGLFEEFNSLREKVRNYIRGFGQKAFTFGKKQFEQVRNFIKARVEVVLEVTKDTWSGLKNTFFRVGKVMRGDFQETLNKALDMVFAEIPPNVPVEVPDEELKRSISEELSHRVEGMSDEVYRRLDIYYGRILDAAAMAVEKAKISINHAKVPLNEAVQDAVEEIVDVALNG
jgi:hypothetical protein